MLICSLRSLRRQSALPIQSGRMAELSGLSVLELEEARRFGYLIENLAVDRSGKGLRKMEGF